LNNFVFPGKPTNLALYAAGTKLALPKVNERGNSHNRRFELYRIGYHALCRDGFRGSGQTSPFPLRLMKTLIVSLMVILAAGPAMAEDRADFDGRILTLTGKFEQLQQHPDKRIPAEVLRNARGIILLDRTKAGVVFAYQGGGGLAMAKDPVTGKWGPCAFLTANEASLGFQIGAEQNFFAIVLMSANTPRFLTDPKFEFGGEARGTAGDTTAGANGTVSNSESPVLIYSERNGLYGGAAIKGGAVSPDENANRIYYGQVLSMKDILFDNKVQPTQAAQNLAAVLASYCQTPKT
jgi:SH3 domain-containing YSC84-like protein 1